MEEVDLKERHEQAFAAADYARAIPPLDQDMGWRREDIELTFIAGAEWRAQHNG